jgi:hypothetical protein
MCHVLPIMHCRDRARRDTYRCPHYKRSPQLALMVLNTLRVMCACMYCESMHQLFMTTESRRHEAPPRKRIEQLPASI